MARHMRRARLMAVLMAMAACVAAFAPPAHAAGRPQSSIPTRPGVSGGVPSHEPLTPQQQQQVNEKAAAVAQWIKSGGAHQAGGGIRPQCVDLSDGLCSTLITNSVGGKTPLSRKI